MEGHPHPAWLDSQARFFNPNPRLTLLPLGAGAVCVVVDDALANPQGVRQWAAEQSFLPPAGYPYPGHVCHVPEAVTARLADFFTQHVRTHLGVRRALSTSARLSIIDTAPAQLAPVQWLCHRDRLPDSSNEWLFAASVLYLFDNPALGGTSFYAPRQAARQTEALVADSQALSAAAFSERYAWQPGYMAGSNAYFDRTAQVPAAWNRLIFYDGSLFHSADAAPDQLHAHPLQGRLTLNSFITCRRNAQ